MMLDALTKVAKPFQSSPIEIFFLTLFRIRLQFVFFNKEINDSSLFTDKVLFNEYDPSGEALERILTSTISQVALILS